MSDIEELMQRKAALMKKISKMQEKVAVAKSNLNRLKTDLQQQMDVLKDKYNVSTLEEAEELRDKLYAKLVSSIEELEDKVREV